MIKMMMMMMTMMMMMIVMMMITSMPCLWRMAVRRNKEYQAG
jgi:hypothetical protein